MGIVGRLADHARLRLRDAMVERAAPAGGAAPLCRLEQARRASNEDPS